MTEQKLDVINVRQIIETSSYGEFKMLIEEKNGILTIIEATLNKSTASNNDYFSTIESEETK